MHHARVFALFAVLGAASSFVACTHADHVAVDAVMTSAYRPPPLAGTAAARFEHPRYELLAGDLHCHVLPPDSPSHVSRDLDDTIDLAEAEGLDFVVLTPHVWSRFFESETLRARVVDFERGTVAQIARAKTEVLIVPGFEYTDHTYGHAGMMFASVERVLADVPLADAQAHPERFFERWAQSGGLLIVNHPLVTPIESSISIARADLSWRPFTSAGPFPAEIRAIDRLASGFEVYNLTATHMRDRYLQGNTDRTLLATLRRLDDEIPKRAQPMTPVGGSDSHSHHLRATTFVLATSRTIESVRDAIAAGRVCVRSPEACSFEARAGGAWASVGESLRDVSAIEVRATGADIEILRNGEVVARPASGAATSIAVDRAKCNVVRARVGNGFSAPIYVNCGFGERGFGQPR
jgi:predicted metal-dependent phosphoesterase TrpH